MLGVKTQAKLAHWRAVYWDQGRTADVAEGVGGQDAWFGFNSSVLQSAVYTHRERNMENVAHVDD